jgi:nucleoside-triphosphatase THEP1
MDNQLKTTGSNMIYYRLVALWVLCEAMLGGIIHGFKIPVSGLVVGSCAISCICLIGWYVPARGAILKATVIVAIFKMMLSPQAPFPAYIAVFFQGLMGELLFWKKRWYAVSCVLLAIIGLLESGLQRILVVTIVYGDDIWKAINSFINGLTKQKTVTNYSFIIAGGYVVLHLLTGVALGWWLAGLPGRIDKWSRLPEMKVSVIPAVAEAIAGKPGNVKKKRRIKIGLFIIWIALLALYIQSYYKIGTPLLPPHLSLKILLRSLIIVFAWIVVVGPVLRYLLHRWLQKRKTRSQQDVQQVLALLPATQGLLAACWKQSSKQKGWRRVYAFCKRVLVNALQPAGTEVYIVTGPIQSGKTTSLIKWIAGRQDVKGVLTPVVDGKRFFMNAATGVTFAMEAAEGEQELLKVGRFVFSKESFDKAIQLIRDARQSAGWLIIDEIGPMELRGEGFHDVLREVLATPAEGRKVIIVIRKELWEDVIKHFGIDKSILWSPGSN